MCVRCVQTGSWLIWQVIGLLAGASCWWFAGWMSWSYASSQASELMLRQGIQTAFFFFFFLTQSDSNRPFSRLTFWLVKAGKGTGVTNDIKDGSIPLSVQVSRVSECTMSEPKYLLWKGSIADGDLFLFWFSFVQSLTAREMLHENVKKKKKERYIDGYIYFLIHEKSSWNIFP